MKRLAVSVEKHKRLMWLIMAGIVLFAFIWYNAGRIHYGSLQKICSVNLFWPIFLGLNLFFGGILVLSYWMLIIKKMPLHRYVLLIIPVLGILYCFVFLPFTVPDEVTHYYAAYRVANVVRFQGFRNSDKEWFKILQEDMNLLKASPSHISADSFSQTMQSLTRYGSRELTAASVSSSNVPAGYILSGIGLAIGHLLHLPPLLSFYLGRLFNLAGYTAMVWYAVKKVPFGKLAFLIIACLPMSLHLAASYSYDGILIGFALCFVAQVLYMRHKPTPLTWFDVILCAVWIILLAPSKIIYFPLLALIFLIPKEKFKSLCPAPWVISWGLVLVGLAALGISQATRVFAHVGAPDGTSGKTYTISWIIQNLPDTVGVLCNTINVKLSFYLNTLVGNSLGHFQVSIPFYLVLPLFFLLGYAFLSRKNEPKPLSFAQKMLLSAAALCVFLLGLFSMMVAWTKLGADVIEGVQGRYFLPLLPVVYLIVRSGATTTDGSRDPWVTFCFSGYSLLLIMEFFARAY